MPRTCLHCHGCHSQLFVQAGASAKLGEQPAHDLQTPRLTVLALNKLSSGDSCLLKTRLTSISKPDWRCLTRKEDVSDTDVQGAGERLAGLIHSGTQAARREHSFRCGRDLAGCAQDMVDKQLHPLAWTDPAVPDALVSLTLPEVAGQVRAVQRCHHVAGEACQTCSVPL